MLLNWILFIIYLLVTIYLAWLGKKKTKSLDSFALGNRDMNPWIVAFALSATMTSTATFVINPGIVYAFGISAFMGYGLAAGFGLFLGTVIFSKGFRRFGYKAETLTVPEWIGKKYDNRFFVVVFALINLFMIAMVVLIAYGSAVLIDFTLDLNEVFPSYHFEIALAFIIAFVFTYIMFGGTYAHAYTNTIQGIIMLTVAVVLIFSGLPYFKKGLMVTLASETPVLIQAINPQSMLFRNFFEVFIANFLVGFALTLQPHFIIKSLYVRTDRDVNTYLTIAICMGVVFLLVLMTGLYARAEFGPEYLINIDQVSSRYIVKTFSPAVATIITIALLAAGMSTLDGILVALSSIVANDLYLILYKKKLAHFSKEERLKISLKVSKYSLVAIAIIAYILGYLQHYHKEFSIAIFAQTWVYALLNATFYPLLCGMFMKNVNKWVVLFTSFVSVCVHIIFRYANLSILTDSENLLIKEDYLNPGLTSSYGLICGALILGCYLLYQVLTQRKHAKF